MRSGSKSHAGIQDQVNRRRIGRLVPGRYDPQTAYATESAANDDGYAMHPAFKDGGETKPGAFVDKYKCSKNAVGAGYVASSIRGGLPISTHADHNPIAGLTACSSNNYYQAINAAHARDSYNFV